MGERIWLRLVASPTFLAKFALGRRASSREERRRAARVATGDWGSGLSP